MKLPITRPYVDRLIRIFRDRPDDDASAVVLKEYGEETRKLALEEAEQSLAAACNATGGHFVTARDMIRRLHDQPN